MVLRETNKVDKQPEIDDEMGFLFFTTIGKHYQVPNSQSSVIDKVKGVEKLPIVKMNLEESKILNQLKKTQANITVFGLFMPSLLHQNSLIKVLIEPMIPPSTTLEEEVNLVGSLTCTGMLSFSEETIPEFCPNHNYAPNICVEVMGKTVPLSFVDNGSALNV